MLWLLLLALAGSKECDDRSPGLSKCVEYEQLPEGGVSCRASCYHGKRPDGGTYGAVVHAKAATEPACLYDLKRQATNGCRPLQSRRR